MKMFDEAVAVALPIDAATEEETAVMRMPISASRLPLYLTIMLIAVVGAAIYYFQFAQRYGRVMGIMYSSEERSVIVDAAVLHEGDELYGVTVAKINKDCVEFSMDNKTWVQRVQGHPYYKWPLAGLGK
jgi:hypothetical protein